MFWVEKNYSYPSLQSKTPQVQIEFRSLTLSPGERIQWIFRSGCICTFVQAIDKCNAPCCLLAIHTVLANYSDRKRT